MYWFYWVFYSHPLYRPTICCNPLCLASVGLPEQNPAVNLASENATIWKETFSRKIKVDPLHKAANIESDEGHKTPRGEIWTTSTKTWLPCSLARTKLTTHRLPASTSSATSANSSAPLFLLLRSELQAAHRGLICLWQKYQLNQTDTKYPI